MCIREHFLIKKTCCELGIVLQYYGIDTRSGRPTQVSKSRLTNDQLKHVNNFINQIDTYKTHLLRYKTNIIIKFDEFNSQNRVKRSRNRNGCVIKWTVHYFFYTRNKP